MALSTDDDEFDLAWRTERFRLLYDAVYDDLWRYCRRRAPNDTADDILAEVLAVAWRRFDDVPSGDDARPWLFAVARNQLRSAWRRRRRTADLTEKLIGDLMTAPLPVQTSEAEAREVLTVLNSLRPADQEVIRLAVWEQLTHRQIGIVFGCTENAAAIRLHRARKRLAARLGRAMPGVTG